MISQLLQSWTSEEKTILSEIVNDEFNLNLFAKDIISCGVNDRGVSTIVWKQENTTSSFQFPTDWGIKKIANKRKELELRQSCCDRGLIVVKTSSEETFCIYKNDQFLGCIGHNDNIWYVLRASSTNGRIIRATQVDDAVFSLWMLEVAPI